MKKLALIQLFLLSFLCAASAQHNKKAARLMEMSQAVNRPAFTLHVGCRNKFGMT